MLTAPTLDKLHALKLDAMAHGLDRATAAGRARPPSPSMSASGCSSTPSGCARENKRLARALQEAKLKLPQACIEAIDYPARRELDKAVIRQLATCRWIEEHHRSSSPAPPAPARASSPVPWPTKPAARATAPSTAAPPASSMSSPWPAPTAPTSACSPSSPASTSSSSMTGPWPRSQDQERRDLLEILEDRYGTRSTIVTSQLPPAQWHDYIGEPTLADAICDRLLHNAHRIVLKVAMGRRPTHAA